VASERRDEGDHLAGYFDTKWKERLFGILQSAYETGKDVGEIELLAKKLKEIPHYLATRGSERAWKPELHKSIAA
jgi:hypothetical protein